MFNFIKQEKAKKSELELGDMDEKFSRGKMTDQSSSSWQELIKVEKREYFEADSKDDDTKLLKQDFQFLNPKCESVEEDRKRPEGIKNEKTGQNLSSTVLLPKIETREYFEFDFKDWIMKTPQQDCQFRTPKCGSVEEVKNSPEWIKNVCQSVPSSTLLPKSENSEYFEADSKDGISQLNRSSLTPLYPPSPHFLSPSPHSIGSPGTPSVKRSAITSAPHSPVSPLPPTPSPMTPQPPPPTSSSVEGAGSQTIIQSPPSKRLKTSAGCKEKENELNRKLIDLEQKEKKEAPDRSETFRMTNEAVNETSTDWSEIFKEINEINGNQTEENQHSSKSSLSFPDPSPSNFNSKLIMTLSKAEIVPIKSGVSGESPPKTSEEVKVKFSITPLVEDFSDRQQFIPSIDIVKKQKADEDNLFLRHDTSSNKPLLKRWRCYECGSKCLTIQEIKNHTCNTQLNCVDCGQIFKNKNVLMQHLKLLHPSKEKDVSCGLCSKKFSSKTNLKFHIDKIHPMEAEADSVNNAMSEPNNNAIIDLGSVFDKNLETNDNDEEAELLALEKLAENLDEEYFGSDKSDDEPQINTESISQTDEPTSKNAEPNLEHIESNLEHVEPISEERVASRKNEDLNNTTEVLVHEEVQQVKSNWIGSLEIRERCKKCGRNNYTEEDIDKHQARCRGTLMNFKSKFECPYCVNPKILFNTELGMRRHVGTTHAKEALEDEWGFEPKKVKTVGLAMKHLFR